MEGGSTEPLPDLGTLSDDDLKALIDKLTHEENEVSFRRRLLQGRDRHPPGRATARLEDRERASSTTSTSRS